MKKRRFIFLRWLLALLLGVGAWWLFRWAITPRVHFEATYRTQDFTRTAQAAMNVLGFETDISNIHMEAHIWDRQGRYLLVELGWWAGFPNCYDLIDLNTGKTVVKQCLTASKMRFRGTWDENRTAPANGDNFGFDHQSSNASENKVHEMPTKEILNRSITFRVDRERREQHENDAVPHHELWSWNPLSNQEKLIQRFTRDSEFKFSHDGTTLLEIERVTPMLPNFLMPLSLSNILTAQVTAEMGLEDLAVMRVWNVPELTLRSTISVPWMYRQYQAELSADGSYLVFRDMDLPREYTSKHRYRSEAEFPRSGDGQGGVKDIYAVSPAGIRVYDTRTGNLWWEKTDYPGVYSDYQQVGHDLVLFSVTPKCLPEMPCLLLHMPSRQLIETTSCASSELLSPGHIQFASLQDIDQRRYQIYVNGSVVNGVQLKSPLRAPQFISGVPQVVVETVASDFDYYPVWLQTLFCSIKWLNDRLEVARHRLEVIDYSANHRLISIPIDNVGLVSVYQQASLHLTDRWMLVRQISKDGLKVSVYSIPFPSWSPLWPWGTGLVVFLFTLYLLRLRQPQRG